MGDICYMDIDKLRDLQRPEGIIKNIIFSNIHYCHSCPKTNRKGIINKLP